MSNQSPPEADQSSPKPPHKKTTWRRGLARLISLLILLLLSVGAYVAWEAHRFLTTAPEATGRGIIVEIEPGTSLALAADQLQKAGAVTDSLRFQVLARAKEQGTRVQAGRFLLNTGWLPERVLEEIVSGKALLYRVTLREGLPWWGVARVLEQEGICLATDFERVIHDPEFLRHWGIPFPSAEGFLYPDTYFMPKARILDENAARAAANRLVDMFWRKSAPLWEQSPPDTATLRQGLTLASIVEKETGVPEERERVAGVYANRIRKNMLLQADPTIIYGLGPSFSGPLRRSHLDDASNAYNTYQKAGLPPGPICSPGLESLRAALNPEKHNFLYFVATGDAAGSHTFSATLTEHNKAVRAYRAAMRGKSTP